VLAITYPELELKETTNGTKIRNPRVTSIGGTSIRDEGSEIAGNNYGYAEKVYE